LDREQIRDWRIGFGQINFGSVDNFLHRRITANDANRLGAMLRVLAASATRLSFLGATNVFRLRQFVSGKVNDVILRRHWRYIGLHRRDFRGKHNSCGQQNTLEQPGDGHAAKRENPGRRLSSQWFA
jgi:hypothetical protein